MPVGWNWEDRMIFAQFVLADGGQVGEVKGLDGNTHLLNMGYVGAGCDHTFTQPFGYSQVENGKKLRTINIKPGQRYREYRG